MSGIARGVRLAAALVLFVPSACRPADGPADAPSPPTATAPSPPTATAPSPPAATTPSPPTAPAPTSATRTTPTPPKATKPTPINRPGAPSETFVYGKHLNDHTLWGCYSRAKGWIPKAKDADCPNAPTSTPKRAEEWYITASDGRVLPRPNCRGPKKVDFELTTAEAKRLVTNAIGEITGETALLQNVEKGNAYEIDLDGDGAADRLYNVAGELYHQGWPKPRKRLSKEGGVPMVDRRGRGEAFESEGWWIFVPGAAPRVPRIVGDFYETHADVQPELCFDFDHDGRTEVFIYEGGESEQVMCLVQLADKGLENLGCQSLGH